MPKTPPLTEAVASAVKALRKHVPGTLGKDLEDAFDKTMASGKTLMEAEGHVAVSPEEMAAQDALWGASNAAWLTGILPMSEHDALRDACRRVDDVRTKEDEG